MSTSQGARAAGARPGNGAAAGRDRQGMTPAQWYCLLAGASLLLAGILGFISDATFDTGTKIQGDGFLGFEVNGWHNLVHILSGLVLLSAFSRRGAAKTVALAFGLVYGLVAIIGLIDGNDVLGLIPINPADNILHLALSAVGVLAALVSPTDEHRGDRTATSERGRTGSRAHAGTTRDDDRFGRDVDSLTGRPRDDRKITSN
jgi:hypothetical protein